MPADLAILYEHPTWFAPLFAALDRRGIAHERLLITATAFDPADPTPPAPIVLSRISMSAFLRGPDHGIFYAASLLDHWQRGGAKILNGPAIVGLDSSKARQLSLFSALNLAIPRTRVVHRAVDLPAAAAGWTYPLLVKANIGGSGAGIVRYDSADALEEAVAAGSTPTSIDRVLLLQDYVPPRGGTILRVETLGGRFLYALEVASGGDSFDLCPADACLARPGHDAIAMRAVTPTAKIIEAAETIARTAGLDVGGVELVIDDRDGIARFYDFNGLSNFVANPMEVLGWDPHERLVDLIEAAIADKAAA